MEEDVKINATFRVKKNIKLAFQAEIILNGGEMSEAIEAFMLSYTNLSRKQRGEIVNAD